MYGNIYYAGHSFEPISNPQGGTDKGCGILVFVCILYADFCAAGAGLFVYIDLVYDGGLRRK